MPNITLSVPDEIYKKMKKYSEIKWSEVVRKAILEYLRKLEENKVETSTKEILKELGEEFKKILDELELEKAVEGYRKIEDVEWKRFYTIYDTSKLIDIYKKDKKAQGYTTIFNLIEFPKALELDLNVLYPTK